LSDIIKVVILTPLIVYLLTGGEEMKLMSGWRMTATGILISIIAIIALDATQAFAAGGAVFASTNTAADGTGHCRNGHGDIDCGIFSGKQFVWIGEGPQSAPLKDGAYFFAVISPGGDPNDGGDNNLSDDLDAYTNRIFFVNDGVIGYGGTHDFTNDKIRLMPYLDTTNAVGEYQMAICSLSNGQPVKVDNCKTDNFKIQDASNFFISGVKYFDQNMDGVFQLGEPTMPGWQIQISTPKGMQILTTDSDGKWSFLLPEDTVFKACEIHQSKYQQAGPIMGAQTSDELAVASGDKCWEGLVRDNITGLNFGSICAGCMEIGERLHIAKTATSLFTRTYAWQINKSVNPKIVGQISEKASVKYAVDISQTGFADSDWQIVGTITVANPNQFNVTGVNVTDAVNDPHASCIVDNGTGVTILKGDSVTLDYACIYSEAPNPDADTNGATAIWPLVSNPSLVGNASGIAQFDFSGNTPSKTVGNTVTVTDTFESAATVLGTATATDTAPYASKSFAYQRTVDAPANDCVLYTNKANIVETGQSANAGIVVCGPSRVGGQ
jgi:hypothetical protein